MGWERRIMDCERLAYLQNLVGLDLSPGEQQQLTRDLQVMAAAAERLESIITREEEGEFTAALQPGPVPLECDRQLVRRNAPELDEEYFAVPAVDTREMAEE